MSHKCYLITGGAGFIGRNLAKELLRRGAQVRILDSFLEQVHGAAPALSDLPDSIDVRQGDIRNPEQVREAIAGVDGVFHLAAEVGVGQSMYEIDRYTAVNDLGTAVLFQELISNPVCRVVVASSMSVYGEGLYKTEDGRIVRSAKRPEHGWDPVDMGGRPFRPISTPETKTPDLASVYALNKFAQERMTLMVGAAYGMEACALRLFNVYGPGQALSNPYTGVLAIFASRLQNGQPPLVFEDGKQRRDFVHVEDVARAFVLAMERPEANGEVINIGSGRSISISETAERLAEAMGRPDIRPAITGKARRGDIRHCFADISKAERLLGFKPLRSFENSLAELADWVAQQKAEDRVELAASELEQRGLVVEVARTPAIPAIVGRIRPILITGGAGFIGSNLADSFASDGRHVLVLDALKRPGVEENLHWLRQRHPKWVGVTIADVTDKDAADEAIRSAKAVFHLAAQVAVTTSISAPEADFEVNARGTLNMLEAARRLAKPPALIFSSTNKVYGDLSKLDFDLMDGRWMPSDAALRRRGISDQQPLHLCTPYGCSKGAADQYVLDYAHNFGLPAAVLRMSCIYGPRQFGTEDQGWVAHFLIRAKHDEPITLYGDGRQVRDILHVGDAVAAYRLLMDNIGTLRGRAFNLGGGPVNSVSLLQLLDEIERLLGRPVAREHAEPRIGDQLYFVSDNAALSAATGWRAKMAWREGLRDLAAWLDTDEQTRALQRQAERVVA